MILSSFEIKSEAVYITGRMIIYVFIFFSVVHMIFHMFISYSLKIINYKVIVFVLVKRT